MPAESFCISPYNFLQSKKERPERRFSPPTDLTMGRSSSGCFFLRNMCSSTSETRDNIQLSTVRDFYDKCFSWQKKDLDWLQSSDLPRICLVKCSDIESQFNIVDFTFSQNNDNRKNSVFNIVLDYDKSGAARPYRPFILALEEGLELSRKLSSAQLKDSIIEDLTKSFIVMLVTVQRKSCNCLDRILTHEYRHHLNVVCFFDRFPARHLSEEDAVATTVRESLGLSQE